MIGIITIPIGEFCAGLFLQLNLKELIVNLFPIIIFSLLLSIGLMKFPGILMKGFNIFGTFIIILSGIGILLVGSEVIFGVIFIKELTPFSEGMAVVGKIAFILGGAYPMLTFLSKIFKNSFDKLGKILEINSISVAGLIGNLASNLLIFSTFKDMDTKGKVICSAFAVSGAFVFGGQLGFAAGVCPKSVGAFMISKFISGILSICIANVTFTLIK
ncbi:ethanolamine transporter EutH [Clostridium tetanomorphum]|uniref:Ethanolamine utilization protein EutH n=1 Tax=Clostridium tetanomorphum TaxID=1553 RepID=A0A923E7Y8_CLOTT|nr:ethanolamine utilization protein EutH [Clostridium tetanomorphum]KAJ53918.1 ethanolamine utilization protein EutH [Clostridium tetanomorphum DSM 665]MBC2398098.1 ethanolamine utilization protein EutH [Clostridium tetanomorphum]MBP1864667.1 ethanolamine transporter EutH [Clostridium tetanomorphum]NRS84137.1 ethanolamine transporter EutH [Clostridium tetanomorphum]NRZ97350.1 ethanolamine transporter EutH [Clostridium tetanomorphum]